MKSQASLADSIWRIGALKVFVIIEASCAMAASCASTMLGFDSQFSGGSVVKVPYIWFWRRYSTASENHLWPLLELRRRGPWKVIACIDGWNRKRLRLWRVTDEIETKHDIFEENDHGISVQMTFMDYVYTYAPTPSPDIIRLILTIAAYKDSVVHQVEI
jgi:hypothetical protein